MTLTPYEHYVEGDRMLASATDQLSGLAAGRQDYEIADLPALRAVEIITGMAQVHALLALDSRVQVPRKNRDADHG